MCVSISIGRAFYPVLVDAVLCCSDCTVSTPLALASGGTDAAVIVPDDPAAAVGTARRRRDELRRGEVGAATSRCASRHLMLAAISGRPATLASLPESWRCRTVLLRQIRKRV